MSIESKPHPVEVSLVFEALDARIKGLQEELTKQPLNAVQLLAENDQLRAENEELLKIFKQLESERKVAQAHTDVFKTASQLKDSAIEQLTKERDEALAAEKAATQRASIAEAQIQELTTKSPN